MGAAIQVDVEDVSGAPGVPAAADLERWAKAALAGQREAAELSIRIVGEEEIAELNLAFRFKPGPTNILSFPLDLPPGVPVTAIGDLVICAPVVAREAAEQGKTPEAHWAHMVVHGCLHLLGYDHMDESQAIKMEPLETAILAGLCYPDPYAPR